MSKLRKSEREREKKSERERERDLGIAREGKKPTEGIEREDKLLIVEARRSERRG